MLVGILQEGGLEEVDLLGGETPLAQVALFVLAGRGLGAALRRALVGEHVDVLVRHLHLGLVLGRGQEGGGHDAAPHDAVQPHEGVDDLLVEEAVQGKVFRAKVGAHVGLHEVEVQLGVEDKVEAHHLEEEPLVGGSS